MTSKIHAPLTASGRVSPPQDTSTAPTADPAKIASIAAKRRPTRGLRPPASVESAAMPVERQREDGGGEIGHREPSHGGIAQPHRHGGQHDQRVERENVGLVSS